VEDGLGDPDLNAEQVARIQQVMTDTGAAKKVEERITDLTVRADLVLATLPLDQSGREVLRALIEAATTRAA
jgi:geranylgeranyl diphosphate synthase type I